MCCVYIDELYNYIKYNYESFVGNDRVVMLCTCIFPVPLAEVGACDSVSVASHTDWQTRGLSRPLQCFVAGQTCMDSITGVCHSSSVFRDLSNTTLIMLSVISTFL